MGRGLARGRWSVCVAKRMKEMMLGCMRSRARPGVRTGGHVDMGQQLSELYGGRQAEFRAAGFDFGL